VSKGKWEVTIGLKIKNQIYMYKQTDHNHQVKSC